MIILGEKWNTYYENSDENRIISKKSLQQPKKKKKKYIISWYEMYTYSIRYRNGQHKIWIDYWDGRLVMRMIFHDNRIDWELFNYISPWNEGTGNQNRMW